MSSSTPLLLITNAGLDVANRATPTGPYIHITGFKIGMGYGYDPQPTDPGLNGTILFEGVPTSYRNIGDNTLDIVCQIPADSGPYDFGEVGLYVTDENGHEVLFAKAVWQYPQTKFSSLGTNVASRYTMHCLLKLSQSITVFKIDTITEMAVWEVDLWSDVYRPADSANPDIPITLVRELDEFNCSSLLHKSNDDKWTIGTNYERYTETTVVNSSTTWVDVNPADFRALDLSSENRMYVVEFPDQGVFRSASALTAESGGRRRLHLNPNPLINIPAPGSRIIVHKNVNYNDPWWVPISADSGNLIQLRHDGIYYGTEAPAEIANLYIDNVNGNDNNAGTRAAPLRTIKEAVNRGPGNVTRTLYLYQGQHHQVSTADPAVLRGGTWRILPYGPTVDTLAPVPGGNRYSQLACIDLDTRIVASNWVSRADESGRMTQYATAFNPVNVDYLAPQGITMVCGSPNGSSDVYARARGSFQSPGNYVNYFMWWARVIMPHADSRFFGFSSVNSALTFHGGGNPVLQGNGRLMNEPAISVSLYVQGITGAGAVQAGRSLVDYMPPGLRLSKSSITNQTTDLDPALLPGGSSSAGPVTLFYAGGDRTWTPSTKQQVFVRTGSNGGLTAYLNGTLIANIARRDKYGVGPVSYSFNVEAGDTVRVRRFEGIGPSFTIYTRNED